MAANRLDQSSAAAIRPLLLPALAALLIWASSPTAPIGTAPRTTGLSKIEPATTQPRAVNPGRGLDSHKQQGASIRALRAVTFKVSGLPASERKALLLLCRRLAGTSGIHDPGHQHAFGPVEEVQLSAAARRSFAAQWASASRASTGLRTTDEARAAGYVQASPFHAGVGTHWIKWSLVGRPFDPAAPSMLLFDERPGGSGRLVGFSYWVGSRTEPEGFAGPNDQWHRHVALCFDRDGWLTTPADGRDCKGFSLNGQSLWMLHAWVVPAMSNPWGRFAPANMALCPPRSVPDVLQCQAA
ncbi:MAG TPA: hypothetical protein VF660_05635 [Actinomycetota bacterium]